MKAAQRTIWGHKHDIQKTGQADLDAVGSDDTDLRMYGSENTAFRGSENIDGTGDVGNTGNAEESNTDQSDAAVNDPSEPAVMQETAELFRTWTRASGSEEQTSGNGMEQGSGEEAMMHRERKRTTISGQGPIFDRMDRRQH